jgi:branched-chain amino acid transport system substrate-binding protein
VAYFDRPARIRSDGRVLFDLTLYRVRAPADSHVPWDYYEALRTIPARDAFLPVNEAVCGA